MKSNVVRVVVFFLCAFLAILLPNGIGWLIKSHYPDLLSQAFGRHLTGILIGIGIYASLYGLFLYRLGSWASQVFPSSSQSPISEDLLKKRLLELNQLDLPFHLREGKKGFLIAEWKIADAKWATILEQGGLKILHQIYLKLDPREYKVRGEKNFLVSWLWNSWFRLFIFSWNQFFPI